jgi:hypothetical protein
MESDGYTKLVWIFLKGLKVFNSGDLVQILWNCHLWDFPGLYMGGDIGVVARKGELVIIVESSNTYVKVLHPQYGIKWVGREQLCQPG